MCIRDRWNVETFVDLVGKDGGFTEEIRRKIVLARKVMPMLNVVWKEHTITRAIKLRLFISIGLFSVLSCSRNVHHRGRRFHKRTNVSILRKLDVNTRFSYSLQGQTCSGNHTILVQPTPLLPIAIYIYQCRSWQSSIWKWSHHSLL